MKGFFVALALFYASGASANLVTVRADYFTPGTNVSTIVRGVTFTEVSEINTDPGFNPVYGDVFAYDDGFGGATGGGFRPWGMVGEAYNCMTTGEVQCTSAYHFLQVDFATPVASYAMTSYWWSDSPVVYAFNSAGALISLCRESNLPGNVGCVGTRLFDSFSERLSLLEFSRTEHDIARLWIGGSSGYVGIREISFSVPEPATSALLGLGLLATFLARRRRAY